MDKHSSLGFLDILLIVFIALKLCHVINWSWWWVLSPAWIGIIIAIFIGIILAAIQTK